MYVSVFLERRPTAFNVCLKGVQYPFKKKKKECNSFTVCVSLLYNEVNQVCVYIYLLPLLHLPPSPTPVPSIWVIAEPSVLYNIFPPAIDTCSIFVSVPLSQFIPPSSPPLCVHMSVSYVLDLYSCLANKFICIIFLGSTYMC